MSLFSYNGITLPYGFTTNFTQEAIYEPSTTDWYLTKFDISVQCILNLNYLSTIAPALAGNSNLTNSADIMNSIRTILLKPKQALSFSFNGVSIVPQIQFGNTGTVDAMNGPKPQNCIITTLTNTSFLLTYRIIAHYWEFPQSANSSNSPSGPLPPPTINQIGNVVLYNRWRESVDIDNCNFSTRTREGRCVIRSDNALGNIADQVRSTMAVVGVPEGFLRKSAHYSVSEDGLSLSYTLVDVEQFKMPPSPAFEAEGIYTETTPRLGMPVRMGEAHVKLKGSKDIDQSLLLQAAIIVAVNKLNLNRVGGAAGQDNQGFTLSFLDTVVVTVNMYKNEVECSIKGFIKPSSAATGQDDTNQPPFCGIMGIDWNHITFTPVSDEQGGNLYVPPYKDRGSANLLLQAAAYYDPNLQSKLNAGTTGQISTGGSVGGGGISPGQDTGGSVSQTNPFTQTQITVTPPNLPNPAQVAADPISTDYQSTSPPIAIWTDYQVVSKFERDEHIYMSGVTSPGGQIPDPNGGNFPPVAFFQMALPTTLWIADWTACKWFEQPEIPDPNDPTSANTGNTNANWILMDQHLEPAMITFGADGVTPLYRISGTYIYGCISPDPDIAIKDIVFPKAPWVFPGSVDQTMPEETLTPGLIVDDSNNSNQLPVPPGQ